MYPVVFTIPWINKDIPGYGLMLMLGFLFAIWWAVRRATRSGGNPDVILNLGFIALLAGVVGARLMYVIHYWDQFSHRGNLFQVLWGIVDVSRGGLEYYGGFVLTILVVCLWLKYAEKVSLRWYFDIVAPSAAIGLAFGRLGCFLNGCCFGAVCEHPWGVQFPYGSPASIEQWKGGTPGAELPQQLIFQHDATGVAAPISRESMAASDAQLEAAQQAFNKADKRLTEAKEKARAAGVKLENDAEVQAAAREFQNVVGQFVDLRMNMQRYQMSAAALRSLGAEHKPRLVHPTQIYSTITAALIALLLDRLYWRRARDGQVIFALLAIEPTSRWVIELIRADNPTDTFGGLTISQSLAIGMTLIGILGLVVLHFRTPRSPAAAIWEPEPESEAKPNEKAGRASA